MANSLEIQKPQGEFRNVDAQSKIVQGVRGHGRSWLFVQIGEKVLETVIADADCFVGHATETKAEAY